MTTVRAVEVGQPGLADDGPWPDGLEVVAIEGDVELADGNGGAFGLIDEALQAVGQLDAAALDADEHQAVGAPGALDDFRGHAHQGPAECALVEKGDPGGHRGGKLVRGQRRRNSRCSLAATEREGFEPSYRLLTGNSLSRRAPSTTRPPLPHRRQRAIY